MHATNFIAVAFVLFFMNPTLASAAINEDCKNHLGGARADVECYENLTNEIIKDNNGLFKKIESTIPEGNVNRKVLITYSKSQDKNVRFCKLKMLAASGWSPDSSAPLLNMYDAIFSECVYEIRKQENVFLKETLNYFSTTKNWPTKSKFP